MGSQSVIAQVVLNEIMAANEATLPDETGTYPDWIELYNAGPDTAHLAGYGLSDDATDRFQWTLPPLTLAPGGFALLFASGREETPPQQWSTVVDEGHSWMYWAANSEPPSDWIEVGFDDAGWQAGPSGFGYGDGDDATVVNPSPALAVFTRTTFTLTNPGALQRLLLHVDFDDAFVAYLNGVEIARANIGTPGGSRPTFEEAADAFGEPFGTRGLPPPGFVFDDPAALLNAGENVLAVQVHNSSAGSSDLSLIPFLTLGYATAAAGRPGLSDALTGLDVFSIVPHAPFRLSANGEAVYLTAPDGTTADSLLFGPQSPDVAFGRHPDGTGAWGRMHTPTPGTPNDTLVAAPAAPPLFDPVGGRYSPFVRLHATTATPEATIHYTLDGRDPEPSDPVLGSSGVRITATQVVRARAFAPNASPSPVVTHTYLIDEDTPLPIVSLTTPPAHLWDEDTGIYALGDHASTDFPYFGANFWEDWEVPVHLELFEPEGGTTYHAPAGMRIFGGWSRGNPQKSLALFARRDYGAAAFDYPLFPNRPYPSYQALVLRNSGNDWNYTMLRDGALQTMVAGLDIDALAHRPVVVYLNGTYWGIHNLREKINEHYVAQVGHTDADAIELLEFAGGVQALHGHTESFEALIDHLEQADLADPTAYAEAARQLDLDSFIDYHLAQIYFDNRDWPGNNNKFWRPTTPEGRWRWILFDTDFGYGIWHAQAYQDNTLLFATDPDGPAWPNPPASTLPLRRLLTNPDFERAFINRSADLMNGPLGRSEATAVIDSLAANLAPEIERHFTRWSLPVADWQRNVDVMRSFARYRPNAMRDHVAAYFGLGGRSLITVDTSDPAQGRVRVNRLIPASYPWSGSYYDGVLVPVTAQPQPGFRFVGWQGTQTGTAATVWVDPATAPTLTARFEPGSSAAQVRINEIQYHPADDQDSDAWVELINPTTEAVDVGGWIFRDGNDDHTYLLPSGTTLAAGGYLVLAATPAAFAQVHPGVPHVGGWDFGLSNSGEAVRLYDATGLLIDSLTYDDGAPWPSEADGDGPTLERTNPALDSTDPATWRASLVAGGTPHAPNSTRTVAREQTPPLPQTLTLTAPYPNPFRTHTTFTYQLPAPAQVDVTVFDALGRRVAWLARGYQPAATPHTLRWDGQAVSPGLYFVRLTATGFAPQTVPVLHVP